MIKRIAITLLLALPLPLLANINPWQSHPPVYKNTLSKPNQHVVMLQFERLQEYIAQHPTHFIITLPLPNGSSSVYRLTPSQTLAPALQKKFPHIQTYRGVAVDQPSQQGRFEITPQGLSGYFLHDQQRIIIQPTTPRQHRVFYRTPSPEKWLPDRVIERHDRPRLQRPIKQRAVSKPYLRRYRMAIATTAEYSTYHSNGATETQAIVSNVMVELSRAVNRLNEIFERDLNMQLELVANNDLLIFTNAASDPYSNSSVNLDIGANQQTIDSVIGSDGYDLGHLFSTGHGGGVAVYGVCESAYKAQGISGIARPEGDVFHVDYVAHEIGHQLGAYHTFNGTSGLCVSNLSVSTAWEPGSGSTIMGYAGLCNAENTQFMSDPYFHIGSIEQIIANTTQSPNKCGSTMTMTNQIPIADAGASTVIPAHTPFVLNGSARDADTTDQHTFHWEQFDLGNQSASADEMHTDDGSRPIIRSRPPNEDTARYIPTLSDLANSSSTIGERLPTTNRTLNFRFNVRDHQGGLASDTKEITVVDNGEPFAMTAPTANSIQDSSIALAWNTANTAAAPIDCQYVDVYLSTDGGHSYPRQIATRIANNGQATLNYFGNDSNTARLMIRCNNNIFFAVSEHNFSVVGATPPPPPPEPPPTPPPTPPSGNSGGGGALQPLLIIYLFCLGVLHRYTRRKRD